MNRHTKLAWLGIPHTIQIFSPLIGYLCSEFRATEILEHFPTPPPSINNRSPSSCSHFFPFTFAPSFCPWVALSEPVLPTVALSRSSQLRLPTFCLRWSTCFPSTTLHYRIFQCWASGSQSTAPLVFHLPSSLAPESQQRTFEQADDEAGLLEQVTKRP